MTRRLIILAILLIPGTAFPASSASDDAHSIRYYDVEIVIFKNLKVPKNKEYILPVSSPQKDDRILDLASARSIEEARASSYEILKYDELKLLEPVSAIINSSRYGLLVHTGWRQPGLELDQTLPVWIKGGRLYGNEYTSIDNRIETVDSSRKLTEYSDGLIPQNQTDESATAVIQQGLSTNNSNNKPNDFSKGLYELEGKITISLSRYLHAYTDLVFRRPRLSVDPVLNTSAIDQSVAEYNSDTRILNNHSLKEHRRMRSKTLHYLDNPEFSMLILISPYDVEANTGNLLKSGDILDTDSALDSSTKVIVQ